MTRVSPSSCTNGPIVDSAKSSKLGFATVRRASAVSVSMKPPTVCFPSRCEAKRRAIASHEDRTSGLGKDERLVTHLPRIRARDDLAHVAVAPAVAAAHDPRMAPPRAQLVGQRRHERRLARASHGDVADHYDWNGKALHAPPSAPIRDAPQCRERAEDQR